MTREELYESDRGEREYYESKRSLKERLKLPLTKDGIETILEMVTKALDLPFDEVTRQDFAGWVHHTEINENSFTLGDLGKVLWNRLSKTATWKMDQEAKERLKAAQDLATITDDTPLTLAKDDNATTEEQPATQ